MFYDLHSWTYILPRHLYFFCMLSMLWVRYHCYPCYIGHVCLTSRSKFFLIECMTVIYVCLSCILWQHFPMRVIYGYFSIIVKKLFIKCTCWICARVFAFGQNKCEHITWHRPLNPLFSLINQAFSFLNR